MSASSPCSDPPSPARTGGVHNVYRHRAASVDQDQHAAVVLALAPAKEDDPLIEVGDRRVAADFAINLSLGLNVLLFVVKGYATWVSGSLAVLASLVDSLLDLLSQLVLWVTERNIRLPRDTIYPAGRRRLEPVGIIVCASLMAVAALEVIQHSIETLISSLSSGVPPGIDMTESTIAILGGATVLKLGLYLYCVSTPAFRQSGTIMALAEDHRNDVLSNSTALVTAAIAHYVRSAWWVDAAGAILISGYIMWSWIEVGKEQVDSIVGKAADPEFIATAAELANAHHDMMQLDIIRAYHFGRNFLVELEMLLPEEMTVRESHDIALSLQQRVEALDRVDRAFVHVDYRSRNYDEHKDPGLFV